MLSLRPDKETPHPRYTRDDLPIVVEEKGVSPLGCYGGRLESTLGDMTWLV